MGVVSQGHVHIMMSCPPMKGPSEFMRRIKARTTNKLLEEFPHLRKKYWGQYFWARGIFVRRWDIDDGRDYPE